MSFVLSDKLSKNLVMQRKTVANPLPAFYKVIIKNSSECTLDMYAAILQAIFNEDHNRAYTLAFQVKSKGKVIFGRFTRDIAESKILEAKSYAYKLRLKLECLIIREDKNAVTGSGK
ncbi:MAG: ATP-dependent Clp protease adaptor ClpS [Rickettsiales bacterium]